MSTKLNMTRDISGYNGYGIMPTYDVQAGVLSDDVAQSIVAPSTFSNWIAIFSFAPGASVWVSFTETAVAPTGAAAASSSVLNPSARSVIAGQTISLVAADAAIAGYSVEFQAIAPYQN
jgi:hypothetical protein